MKPIQEIYPLLATPRNVVITTHQKPDADAMGSSLAMYHLLTSLGHTVTVISPTNWAKWLDWMPGCSTVIDYELQRDRAESALQQAQWVFCLDFNVLIRIKHMAQSVRQGAFDRILLRPRSASFQVLAQTIELSREFTFDSTQTLGLAAETDLLTQELERDMVQTILRRLEALARAGN